MRGVKFTGLLIPLIFVFILKDFFDLLLTNRYISQKKQYFIWSCYFICDISIGKLSLNGIQNILYSIVILFLLCRIVYTNDKKYIVIIVLFITCVGSISELVIAYLFRLFLNTSQFEEFSLFGSICSKLIVLIIIQIIRRMKIENDKVVSITYWIAHVLMATGSLYIIYNLYILSDNATNVYGTINSTIIILLLDIISFKMFDKISNEAESRMKNVIYRKRIELYKKEKEDREANSKRIRKFNHDIKNHLIMIEDMAIQGENDKLISYIKGLTGDKGIFKSDAISGNSLLDSLLNNKLSIADKYNIKISYDIKVPSQLPIDDADLCIIIGNAMDNAIEGVRKVENGVRKIYLELIYRHDNLFMKVVNSCNKERIHLNKSNLLISDKKDEVNHGLGITIMKEITEKYNGLFKVKIENGYFELNILLYKV